MPARWRPPSTSSLPTRSAAPRWARPVAAGRSSASAGARSRRKPSPSTPRCFEEELNVREPVGLDALGQVSMPITDVARSTAFYRDQLGLAHLYTFGELAFFD